MDNNINEIVLSAVLQESIKNCYVHPVTLELVFKELDMENFSYETIETQFKESKIYQETIIGRVYVNLVDIDDIMEKVKKFIDNLTWDTIVLNSMGKTTIVRKDTESNLIPNSEFKYNLRPSFIGGITGITGISLKELTGGVYRMKCDKYNWKNERYIGITFYTNSMIEVEFHLY